LLASTLGNVNRVVADFEHSMDNSWRQAIKSSLSDAYTSDDVAFYEKVKARLKQKALMSAQSSASDAIQDIVTQFENKTEPALGPTNINEENVDPYNKLFENPAENDDVFSLIDLSKLNLPATTVSNINDQIQAALALTDNDVANMRQTLDDSAAVISDFFGGGSADYDRVNGRSTTVIPGAVLTTDRIKILSALNDAAMSMDEMTIYLRQNRNSQHQDYSDFYRNYMTTQGIDFQENSSKFYVPFPFGASLEMLALQYLNDSDRWIEIASINGLKQPYIDEEGFFVPLSSSGASNSVIVGNSDNLYIGQSIFIQSNTQRPEKRKINAIDSISDVEIILTLNGSADLDRFTISDGAMIHAYLPGTVNSNMLIAVPSSVAVNVPNSVRTNPSEQELNFVVSIAKADFMLQFSYNGESDIAFTGSDVAIARGYQNLLQAANIKVLTPQGSLLNDPSFGNPVSVGNSVAEVDAANSISQLSSVFSDDARFTGLIGGRINVNGPATTIDLIVGIAGTQAFLPFTTALPK
jgi:hypothetical protein